MITQLLISCRAILAFTVLTGLLYPLAMTGMAQILFPGQANGSLVIKEGHVAGSALLAQKFTSPRYFWPRPSAADYATVASGASNQGFTSRKLVDAVNDRKTALGPMAPADLLYASGSGLDPDISPEAAEYQAERVAAARGVSARSLRALIAAHVQPPQFGFLGQPRVNVLLLNRDLDDLK